MYLISAVLLPYGVCVAALRSKLAEAFSACILARRCKPECGHALKSVSYRYSSFRPVDRSCGNDGISALKFKEVMSKNTCRLITVFVLCLLIY